MSEEEKQFVSYALWLCSVEHITHAVDNSAIGTL